MGSTLGTRTLGNRSSVRPVRTHGRTTPEDHTCDTWGPEHDGTVGDEWGGRTWRLSTEETEPLSVECGVRYTMGGPLTESCDTEWGRVGGWSELGSRVLSQGRNGASLCRDPTRRVTLRDDRTPDVGAKEVVSDLGSEPLQRGPGAVQQGKNL